MSCLRHGHRKARGNEFAGWPDAIFAGVSIRSNCNLILRLSVRNACASSYRCVITTKSSSTASMQVASLCLRQLNGYHIHKHSADLVAARGHFRGPTCMFCAAQVYKCKALSVMRVGIMMTDIRHVNTHPSSAAVDLSSYGCWPIGGIVVGGLQICGMVDAFRLREGM